MSGSHVLRRAVSNRISCGDSNRRLAPPAVCGLSANPSLGHVDTMEDLVIGSIAANTHPENAGLCRAIGVQESAAFH